MDRNTGSSTLSVTTLRIPYAQIGDDDPLPVVDRTLEGSFEFTEQCHITPARAPPSDGRDPSTPT